MDAWKSHYVCHFYPRSPCGERPGKIRIFNDIFNFYPRSPCGERRIHYDNYNLHCVISIHALLAESDPLDQHPTCRPDQFLSTLSLRRATYLVRGQHPSWGISIHALLAESDVMVTLILTNAVLFLSTLSLRRATVVSSAGTTGKSFLSTLSLRRATLISMLNRPNS